MAFKTMEEYTESKNSGKFVLQNDGDSARVVFMYKSPKDVLLATCHYIKTTGYTGYVHCTGSDCPACAKNIRKQDKLFIPLYNVETNEFVFWDRSPKFQPQLAADVLRNYPNPSEYVFRITRKGASGDLNTRYVVQAVNKYSDFNKLISDRGIVFPDCYNDICKDVDASTMSMWLNASTYNGGSADDLPDFTPQPRASVASVTGVTTDLPELPDLPEPDFGDADFDED